MESEVIQPLNEIKKVDRFGFFEEDTGRSRLIRRLFRIEPVFDVKLENQRLHKWLDMLKNWETWCVWSFLYGVDSAKKNRRS